MASRNMTAGLIIVLIAAVLLVLSSFIGGFAAGVATISGGAGAAAGIQNIVMGAVYGLFIIGLIVCLIGLIIARLEYNNYTYAFEEFNLKLTQGIIGLTEVSIPYRQMQDIDVERTLLHRMTGTSRVIIDSAGHEEVSEKNETDIILDPIDMEAAEEIRVMMQRRIGVQVVEGDKAADREFGAETGTKVPPQPGEMPPVSAPPTQPRQQS